MVCGAVALCMALCMGVVSCGDDDSDGSPGGTGGTWATGGTGGSADAGGSGGSGGASGSSAGMGGTGASVDASRGDAAGGTTGFTFPDAGPVMCGGQQCTAPEGSPLSACCTAADVCGGGLAGTCQEWDMPGTLDPSCPDHAMAMGGTTLSGCCKPNGNCGVMSSAGLGCVERTELAGYAGGPLDQMACGGGG